MSKGKSRGFLFTVATFLMLLTMLSFLGSFAERQLSYQQTISREVVSYKLSKIWEDVQEDMNDLWDLNITIVDGQIIIEDTIPAVGDPGEFLAAYGKFVEDYYETDDVDLKFLDPSGNEMNLGDLESKLRILPCGIEYGYPNFGKNRLQVKVPTENVTCIQEVKIILDLTNDTVNETKWDPAPKSCTGDRICLPFYIEISGQIIRDEPTPVNAKSTLRVDCTEGGPSCVTIIIGETNPKIGELQNVFDITLQEGKLANVDTQTVLLLNTTDFSINYMAKFFANETNYEMKMEDWM